MISLIGFTPWGTGRSWVAGTAPGDLAVLVLSPGFIPGGWHYRGEMSTGLATFRIYTQVVTAANIATPLPLQNARLMVFRGTSGISAVRQGTAGSVAAGGGIVTVGLDYPLLFGGGGGAGVAWLTPHLSVGGFMGMSQSVRTGWGASASGGVIDAGGLFTQAFTLVLSPTLDPSPPLWVSPSASQQIAATNPLVLQWAHQPSTAQGSMDAYRLQRTLSDDLVSYWNDSLGDWVAGEVFVSSSTPVVSIPPGRLVENDSTDYQVATRESMNGLWSAYGSALRLTAVQPPSVTITSPATSTDTLSPATTWDAVTPTGAQTHYRVRWLAGSTVIADSGVVASDQASWSAPATTQWTRGESYTVEVTIWQTGGASSEPATKAVVVTWTPPTAPTVTATQIAMGGIELLVSGTSPGSTVEVSRVRDGEVDLVFRGEVHHSAVAIRDPFAPYGIPVTYRVRTSGAVSGATMMSDVVSTVEVTSTDVEAYIASAVDPFNTFQHLWVEDRLGESPVHLYEVMYGIGDDHPRVAMTPPRGVEGSWTIRVDTIPDWERLFALLKTGEVMVVRMPPLVRNGVLVDGGIRYISVAGRITHAPDISPSLETETFTLKWVSQNRPEVGASMAPTTSGIQPA